MDSNFHHPTLAEFLAEESSPSTLIQTLTNQAISLISSHNLTSPFFPEYFIPGITTNNDGHISTGLKSLLSAHEKTIQSNPNLRIQVLNSTVEMKSNVGWVKCNIRSEGFANGMTRTGNVMAKWITTEDGWMCGEWRFSFGMVPPK